MRFSKVIKPTLSEVFSGGCLGGFANGIAVWGFGAIGITKLAGVSITPEISPAFLYPRIVWGGLWGILFLLPFFRRSSTIKGLIYSLAPSLVQLLIIFPYKLGKGLFGLKLGILTPLFVLIFNAIWGISTALWLQNVARK